MGDGEHDELEVEFARIMEVHAAAQGVYEVQKMETARGTVAGEDDFSNIQKVYILRAKLLQKSEMRKDIVIELSYKGFG